MAELTPEEKDAISHRGRAARALPSCLREKRSRRGPWNGVAHAAPGGAAIGAGQRPAAARRARRRVSIVSNTLLIVLKLTAGVITGSIAIITEAVHSSIDLVASVVAYFSVRKAEEPADERHPYGHEKVENLAAAIEGMLILVGAGDHHLRVGAAARGRARGRVDRRSASR